VGCNNSVFVSDVTYPDNTVVTPGQAIKKTWKLQNTGSCAWTPTYKVTFISGSAMGGVATAIGITVASGASGDVTVDMIAPATAGEVIGYWILTNDSGQNFGSNFYVQVRGWGYNNRHRRYFNPRRNHADCNSNKRDDRAYCRKQPHCHSYLHFRWRSNPAI
jgi:hypothetical protein